MASALRLADLLGVLSLGTDLGMGQPVDFARSSCALALRLAEAAGFDDAELLDVYDYAHLRYVGCNADTDVLAALLGDEFALRRDIAPVDQTDRGQMLPVVLRAARRASAGGGPLATAAATVRALLGTGAVEATLLGHCEVGQGLAARLGSGPGVVRALGQLYGRWDGKGVPAVGGDEVSAVAMCVALAQDVLLHQRLDGSDTALAVARSRSGQAYRPDLVDALDPAMLAGLDEAPTWEAMLDLEPGEPRRLEGASLSAAFEAVGDFADIKSPWRVGHSAAVAALAARAAALGGLSGDEVVEVRHAGYVQDLGVVGVSAAVWGRPRLLTAEEWDVVRLHPYHSERVLARAEPLAAVAALAGTHHERADGSGYHRGVSVRRPAAQVLAAADMHAALVRDRPHRPARAPEEAARLLRVEASRGRLDGDVVDCVLAAAGRRPGRQVRSLSAGLTEREAEVLRLVARGRTTAQVARQLGISPKTADKHLQRIYDKTGRRTRAGVTLYAMEHGLV